MPKSSVVFVCSDCGGESLRWAGQCPHCRAWNTLQEFKPPDRKATGLRATAGPTALVSTARPITEIEADGERRLRLDWEEVNRVLGGGIVGGSLVLVGGEPGVGKSTLLMHVAAQVCAAGGSVLYASGEESAHQVRMRAGRLEALRPDLLILAENDLDPIVESITSTRPALAIVDSIQTVFDPSVDAAAGSVSQVREGAARLMRVAKSEGIPIFLVGHVTKEGMIAGPRLLEHMVDTVLYLEGDRHHEFRILRATKNRFGSTDEIGIFTMGERGLEEVADASLAMLGEGSLAAEGTVVLPTIEGTRPILVELQSLVTPTAFGLPRRSANGIDLNRLHMITAVLEKRARLNLGNSDLFVNVAGGMRIVEPAADLALALSVVSNTRSRAIGPGTIVVGELGLTGEVRPVGQLERRLGEASRRGFQRAIVPASRRGRDSAPHGMAVIRVSHLTEAIAAAFEDSFEDSSLSRPRNIEYEEVSH